MTGWYTVRPPHLPDIPRGHISIHQAAARLGVDVKVLEDLANSSEIDWVRTFRGLTLPESEVDRLRVILDEAAP